MAETIRDLVVKLKLEQEDALFAAPDTIEAEDALDRVSASIEDIEDHLDKASEGSLDMAKAIARAAFSGGSSLSKITGGINVAEKAMESFGGAITTATVGGMSPLAVSITAVTAALAVATAAYRLFNKEGSNKNPAREMKTILELAKQQGEEIADSTTALEKRNAIISDDQKAVDSLVKQEDALLVSINQVNFALQQGLKTTEDVLASGILELAQTEQLERVYQLLLVRYENQFQAVLDTNNARKESLQTAMQENEVAKASLRTEQDRGSAERARLGALDPRQERRFLSLARRAERGGGLGSLRDRQLSELAQLGGTAVDASVQAEFDKRGATPQQLVHGMASFMLDAAENAARQGKVQRAERDTARNLAALTPAGQTAEQTIANIDAAIERNKTVSDKWAQQFEDFLVDLNDRLRRMELENEQTRAMAIVE